MRTASGRPAQAGLGHFFKQAVLLGGGTFVALALFPLTITLMSAAAIPLTGLLATSRPREPKEIGVLAGSLTLAIWWLSASAEFPGQVLRASALFAGVTYVVLTLFTRLSNVHRTLAALATAATAATVAFVALGTSWGEVVWWVQFRVGLATRVGIGAIWTGADTGVGVQMSDPAQVQGWLESTVTLAGELFGAILAVTLGMALYLATVVYRRVAATPRGRAPDRLADFRFSDHLGWAAVLSLAVVLIPKLVLLKTAATNVLLVSALLYGLRGVAVLAFFLEVVGGAGVLLSLFLAVIIFVMLPVVLGGAVLLGVLDTGLDFRRRWKMKPPTGA